MSNVISFKDVSLNFGGVQALKNISFDIQENSLFAIIGPNGAGKSTLLKAIMSLIKVSAGRFFVNGEEKTNLSTHRIVMEGIGYVPQVANVFPSLTIDENLELSLIHISEPTRPY